MAFLVFTIISTFLGQALNGKRCSAVAPKLDKMSTIAVIISQYLTIEDVAIFIRSDKNGQDQE